MNMNPVTSPGSLKELADALNALVSEPGQSTNVVVRASATWVNENGTRIDFEVGWPEELDHDDDDEDVAYPDDDNDDL